MKRNLVVLCIEPEVKEALIKAIECRLEEMSNTRMVPSNRENQIESLMSVYRTIKRIKNCDKFNIRRQQTILDME